MRMPPMSPSLFPALAAHLRSPLDLGLTAPLSRRQACRSRAHLLACAPAAANDSMYFSIQMDEKVRILRRSDETDRARMVLSGRMADVCAALERLSRAEAISAVR